jgi:hypothetical protein
MTAVLAASVALAATSVAGSVAAGEELPPVEPIEAVAPSTTAPETLPADTTSTTSTSTSTTIPEETGEVDGVEVAVGLPPVPPIAPPTEVGIVDGVEVAVGPPPVPPTVVTVSARPAGSRERTNARTAPSRSEALMAATQMIESMQTIDVLLDAWT